MSLEDTFSAILRDPDYAGLHWSIPRNTPLESRTLAHLIAAREAKHRRDKAESRQHRGPVDMRDLTYQCCGQTTVNYMADPNQPAWCRR